MSKERTAPQTQPDSSSASTEGDGPARARTVAEQALAEAAARRAAAKPQDLPPELGGRDGPEPTRFGDWEKDGIISDF